MAAMAKGYAEKAGEKLTNGVANAATGFLELSKTAIIDSQSPAYGMTFGVIKGFWNALFRIGLNIYDAATLCCHIKILVTLK